MSIKLGVSAILITAGMLLVFSFLGMGSNIATAAKSPADFAANQFTPAIEQTSPPIRLAQSAPSAGTMLGGVGLFGPSGIINPPGGFGGTYFVPEPEPGVPIAPPAVSSPYLRCPYGGFDCDLF